VVYNGLVQVRSSIVHLPVSMPGTYKVDKVDVGNSTFVSMSEAIRVLESDVLGGAPYRLPFLAAHIPPMGAIIYKISAMNNSSRWNSGSSEKSSVRIKRRSLLRSKDEVVVASNEYFTAIFDG